MLVRCHIHDGKLQRIAFVPGLYKGNGPPDFFQPFQAPQIVKDIQKISAHFGTQFEVQEDDVAVTLGEAS
jgi:hypothetical protein